MRPEPRPELAALPAAIHGGNHDPRLVDFSTGVSPLPPPDPIVAAVRKADLSRYPHPTALPARQAIGVWHDLPASQVVVGAGSVELIWALARAFAGPDRRGLVVKPAFAEYEQALRASGATVVAIAMVEPRFGFPSPEIEAALATGAIATAFVCRPSNPCLTAAPAAALTSLARCWPATLFVVDEAYLPMFEGIDGVPLEPNIAVLRSLTKIFALPGLRLGYLLAAPPIAAAVQAALPPWNVSSPAQAAAVAAAGLMPSHLAPIRAHIAALRSSLAERLASVAGRPAQAGGPFLLYENEDAPALVGRLREHGVQVRHAASFGLPRHIRIGVRTEQDHERLARAWRVSSGAVPAG
jgi:histidinol-phosphate/aromatic aminotransferase/cobyric acid decarboxylase-like protein